MCSRGSSLLFFICVLICSDALKLQSCRTNSNLAHSCRVSSAAFLAPELAADAVSASSAVSPDFAGQIVTTFLQATTSRVTAIIIGNILAGAFVKYATDFFRNGVKKKTKIKVESDRVDADSGEADLGTAAWFKLAACIAIDLLGDASYALPGIGELEDAAWAPMSSYALKVLFGSNSLAGLDFVKELLPGTDILPVATLAWVFTYLLPQNPISESLGLKANKGRKKKGDKNGKDNFIDV